MKNLMILLVVMVANFTMAQQIENFIEYPDGTYKINTLDKSYLISYDNKTLRDEDSYLKYQAVIDEDDLKSLAEYKSGVRITEDETGIYFYYYDILVVKYELVQEGLVLN